MIGESVVITSIEPSKGSLLACPSQSEATLQLKSSLKYQVLSVGTFGDMFFVVFDKTNFFDCWSCEPVLKFFDKSGSSIYPPTQLPETRHFLGAEAYIEERLIIASNFQYGKGTERTVNIYMYTVESDFVCTLQKTITCDASQFSGSGLTGRLSSLNAHTHVVAFADFANCSEYCVMSAHVGADGGVVQQIVKHDRVLPPGFRELEEVFFLDGNRIYGAKAQRVAVMDAVITLAIAVTNGSSYAVVFEKIVALPFGLPRALRGQDLCATVERVRSVSTGNAPLLGGEQEVQVQRQSHEQEHVQGQLCLVRVDVSLGNDNDRKIVWLLVNLESQHVLDMCVATDPYGHNVFISLDGASIVKCLFCAT